MLLAVFTWSSSPSTSRQKDLVEVRHGVLAARREAQVSASAWDETWGKTSRALRAAPAAPKLFQKQLTLGGQLPFQSLSTIAVLAGPGFASVMVAALATIMGVLNAG
jgi:hypothetical protein